MESHTLLLEDQRSLRSGFDDNGNHQHRDGEQKDQSQGTDNIDDALNKTVKRVGKRNLANMDHRQTVQIFGIRSGRDNIVIIRDKLGVDTGFFRCSNNFFQMVVVVDGKGNGNFVKIIFGQYFFQIVNASYYRNVPVAVADGFVVVQDPVNVIAPLRMS